MRRAEPVRPNTRTYSPPPADQPMTVRGRLAALSDLRGWAEEDHMAALHRLPNAPIHVHEADLAAAQSWEGLRAAYGSDESYVADMLARFRRDFFYIPRPDAIGYMDGAVWKLRSRRVRGVRLWPWGRGRQMPRGSRASRCCWRGSWPAWCDATTHRY